MSAHASQAFSTAHSTDSEDLQKNAKTCQEQKRYFYLWFIAVSEAARSGYAALTGGGTAVDAVEAAVVCMENNPIFNAGKYL